MTLVYEEKKVVDVIKDAEDLLLTAQYRAMYYGYGWAASKASEIVELMDRVLRDFDFKEAEE